MGNRSLPLLVLLLFVLFRFLIHAVRDIIWRLNGTYSQLQKNRQTASPENVAQVLKIKWKFRYDIITQSNKVEDFILFHDSFQNEDYILRDEVTLYHMNATEVVFVECLVGDSVWDMSRYSFSREAQFKTALKVIILPLTYAQRLVKRIGRPCNKLIFLGNISRCGSTLLCRMFQTTGHYVSYSEPSVISDLHSYDKEDELAIRHVLMVISFMCKPMSNSKTDGHIIKISASSTQVIKMLYNTFPQATFLFMYRNQLPVMKSLARLIPSLRYFKLFKLLQTISPKLASKFDRHNNNPLEYPNSEIPRFNKQLSSPYCTIFPLSLNPVITYYKFLKEGINIKAIRFEDLIQYPEDSLGKIFSVCEIPSSYIGKALRPLDKDSQENSAMSGRRLSSYQIPKFTEDDAEEVEKICKWFQIPNVLEEHMLPRTLTMSGSRTKSRQRLLSRN